MPDERTAGVELDEFLDLFLDADDFDEPMRCVQDTREQGPDPGDVAFPRSHGLYSGFAVWMGSTEHPVWRLVDIRWVFPDSDRARAYHVETLAHNSEGAPPVDGAPVVGRECHVFGGRQPTPIPDVEMTTYYYLFRVLNVVVKLFVAQGPALPPATLQAAQVADIAVRIEKRIRERAV